MMPGKSKTARVVFKKGASWYSQLNVLDTHVYTLSSNRYDGKDWFIVVEFVVFFSISKSSSVWLKWIVNSEYIDVAKPVPQLCVLEIPPACWVATKPSCTTNSAKHSTNNMQMSADDMCVIAWARLQPTCIFRDRLDESVKAYVKPTMNRVNRRDTRPETKILAKSCKTRRNNQMTKYPRLCEGLKAT